MTALASPTLPLVTHGRSLLGDALAPVAGDLEVLETQLVDLIPVETATGRDVLTRALGGGGKRIRPALYLLAARLLGYRGEHLYPIAAVTEFVHTASLLHDDVVDDSTLRRGKPTANAIFGDETSVLVGDLIYASASELMAATGNMEIVRTFARAIRLMSEGELLQLENVFNPAVSEKTYLRILECKTAILIDAACRAAGLLAGASAQEVAGLAKFGHAVGMAFQLIDDALDYTGAAEILGKPALTDLPAGKVTLPLILLFERAGHEAEPIATALSRGVVDQATALKAQTLTESHRTVDATIARAQDYTNTALGVLQQFPASAARQDMERLAAQLSLRFH